MPILIARASGMLGTDLQAMLSDRDVTPFGRAYLDVTDLDAVRSAVVGHDVVVKCASCTKVDRAESD
jgi:dTDP-4-dehydrorhamnose reductase